MFILKNGSLSMEDQDIEHLIGWMDEENYSPKEALKVELDNVGLSIKKVKSVELTGRQMSNEKYREAYSKIVCDFWNNK